MNLGANPRRHPTPHQPSMQNPPPITFQGTQVVVSGLDRHGNRQDLYFSRLGFYDFANHVANFLPHVAGSLGRDDRPRHDHQLGQENVS